MVNSEMLWKAIVDFADSRMAFEHAKNAKANSAVLAALYAVEDEKTFALQGLIRQLCKE